MLQLADPVQEMLMRGDIDMGHARALLPLSGVLQAQLAPAYCAEAFIGARSSAWAQLGCTRCTPPVEEDRSRWAALARGTFRFPRCQSGDSYKQESVRAGSRSILVILTSSKDTPAVAVKHSEPVGAGCSFVRAGVRIVGSLVVASFCIVLLTDR